MHRIVKRDLKHTKKGDFATVLREWRPLAEQGNAVAQYNLSAMYYNGQGVLQNNVYVLIGVHKHLLLRKLRG